MTGIILHHYAISTHSERVRLTFGLKRMAGRSVVTPPAMPKTDLPPDGDPSGLMPGTKVVITPDDTGRDPVEGMLLAADALEVVIRWAHPRVGAVNLHFPRAGYDVVAASETALSYPVAVVMA